MKSFSSRPFTVNKDTQSLYEIVSSPKNLEPYVAKVSDKVDLSSLKLSDDTLTVDVPKLGEMTFEKGQCTEPNRVCYVGKKTPVPVNILFDLTPVDGDKTQGKVTLEASIPPFLGGMLESKIKPILEKVSSAIENFDFGKE